MKKLLVTGQTRSGTSLVANFLNAQEGCVVYSDFFGAIVRGFTESHIKGYNVELTTQQKEIVLQDFQREYLAVGINADSSISLESFQTLGELYTIALDMLAEHRGAFRLTGHKITRIEHLLEKLLLETDLSAICIVRDLRDVMLSAKAKFKDTHFIRSCLSWRYGLNTVNKLEAMYPDRMYLMRFENFISDTTAETKRLSKFLHVELNPNIEQLKFKEEMWQDNSSFNDISRNMDTRVIGRWKQHRRNPYVIIAGLFQSTTKLLPPEAQEVMRIKVDKR